MNLGAQEATGRPGELTRREVLAALARWTVPTVLTLSLATRSAYAAASCPPCTRKSGGRCTACTTSAILNCNCETPLPCLGPPYCPAASGVSPMQPSAGMSQSSGGNAELINALRRRRVEIQADRTRSLFGRPDSLFGGSARSPFGRGMGSTPEAQRLRNQAAARQGLYDRLRDFDSRRRP